jgi:membrane-bound metal-dependent hydrolase YbcI (DUF457 family)
MAQAGIHALVGTAVRKIAPKGEWIMLGIILGSIFPDLDNFAVAFATIAKINTQGLHRTFTHSIFTILTAIFLFFLISRLSKQTRWMNFGLGFSVGIGMHIILDLLLWFNGVELLWPIGGWVNLWENIPGPIWFMKIMDPLEFLFIGLYFSWLLKEGQIKEENLDFLPKLRLWRILMFVLLIVFLPLAYLLSKGFLTFFGIAYLFAITTAFVVTIRMRKTISLL